MSHLDCHDLLFKKKIKKTVLIRQSLFSKHPGFNHLIRNVFLDVSICFGFSEALRNVNKKTAILFVLILKVQAHCIIFVDHSITQNVKCLEFS